MKGKVNMSGFPDFNSFDVLPEGTYLVEIVECADKVTKSYGDPMVNICMKIKLGEYEGRKIWDNIIFPVEDSPAKGILSRTKMFLKSIQEPCLGDEIAFNSDNWVGKTINIKTTNETYNGKERTKVAEYVVEKTDWKEEEESPL